MKIWKCMAIVLSISAMISAESAPLNKDIQADILMNKITTLFLAKKETDALPYFSQLEAMDTKLPESFYYYYIDALDKSGDKEKTVKRAEDYLSRYGTKGKYYNNVVQIISRVSIQLEKETAQKKADTEKKMIEDAEAKIACKNNYESKLRRAKQKLASAERACEKTTYPGNSFCFNSTDLGERNRREWESAKSNLDDLNSDGPQCD